jgi:hypothetical protein
MPTVLQCHQCQKKMRVPDGVNGTVRCPQCGAAVHLGQAAAAPSAPVAVGVSPPAPDWFNAMLESPQTSSSETSELVAYQPPEESQPQAPASNLPLLPAYDDIPPEPWYYHLARVAILVLVLIECIVALAYGLVLGILYALFNQNLGVIVGTAVILFYGSIAVVQYAFGLMIIDFFSNIRAIRYRYTQSR